MTGQADILHKGFDEFLRFVNPIIAKRAMVAGEPLRIVRVEESLLVDDEGRRIEDFHGTQALGHRNPRIADAVRGFLDSDAPSWYPSRVSPFGGRLARRLYERTGYDNAFFALSGSDAVEAALKLARARSRRPRILGIQGAYHGCTYGSCALMSPGPYRDPFAPHLPGVELLPFGDADALARALEPGDVAAVVVEPIQGEGGVRILPPAYVAALCESTARHGTLLVADEAQTGMGRTGRGLLASGGWPRRPDVVCLAKTLGGGLIPIPAPLPRRELFEGAYGNDYASGEAHNTTFSTNAVGCVAALAALDLVTDELVARVREVGARFRLELERTLAGSPLFVEVRGEGLMVGVLLKSPDHPWLTFEHFGMPELAGEPVAAPLLCHRLYRRGFYCFTCGHDWRIMRIQPRFDVPEETLREFARACREELDRLAELT